MSHRVGICQSCQTRFQIPATFAPNRAKCRNCGGVVAIGPPHGAPARATQHPPRAPRPLVDAPAVVPERSAPLPPPPAPAPMPQPVAAEPAIAPPAAKRGLLRALLFAGIAAVLAIGLWSLFA